MLYGIPDVAILLLAVLLLLTGVMPGMKEQEVGGALSDASSSSTSGSQPLSVKHPSESHELAPATQHPPADVIKGRGRNSTSSTVSCHPMIVMLAKFCYAILCICTYCDIHL